MENDKENNKEFLELQRKNGLLRAELDGLAHAISHDLRDPLRAIVGLSGLLKRSVAGRLEEKEETLLHDILLNAEQLNIYVEAVLRYSRLSQRELHVMNLFDMEKICRRAADTASGERPEPALDLVIHSLPGARGDAPLVEQVFAILLDNAIRFACPARPLKVEVSGQIADGMAVYTVVDNGEGFPQERAEDLFALFATLGSKEQGNAAEGVGLALAQRILSRHDGWMKAEGRLGEGAKFTIALPALSELE